MVEAGEQYLNEFVTQLIVEEKLDLSWFGMLFNIFNLIHNRNDHKLHSKSHSCNYSSSESERR